MRITLIKFSLIIISVMLIDGGKTFISAVKGDDLLSIPDHNKDLELPHGHHSGTLADSDKLIEKHDINNSSPGSVKPCRTIYNSILKSQDYFSSIWQPPKSL